MNVPNTVFLRSVSSGSRCRSEARTSGRNLKLEIEYDGTNYCGWQTQSSRKDKPSIQQTLEQTLQKILREKIKLIGASRTDSGVHALNQVANFLTASDLNLARIQGSLNSLLAPDIFIKKISSVDLNFHSRYCARSKVYRYLILNQKFCSPFWQRFCWHVPYPLDLALMRKEAGVLKGKHNFQAFCASGSAVKDTLRRVEKISLGKAGHSCWPDPGNLLLMEIEADSFLYRMVRGIAGTLVEIGRGRLSAGDLKKILVSRERRLCGPTAPAKGLFLVEVKY